MLAALLAFLPAVLAPPRADDPELLERRLAADVPLGLAESGGRIDDATRAMLLKRHDGGSLPSQLRLVDLGRWDSGARTRALEQGLATVLVVDRVRGRATRKRTTTLRDRGLGESDTFQLSYTGCTADVAVTVAQVGEDGAFHDLYGWTYSVDRSDVPADLASSSGARETIVMDPVDDLAQMLSDAVARAGQVAQDAFVEHAERDLALVRALPPERADLAEQRLLGHLTHRLRKGVLPYARRPLGELALAALLRARDNGGTAVAREALRALDAYGEGLGLPDRDVLVERGVEASVEDLRAYLDAAHASAGQAAHDPHDRDFVAPGAVPDEGDVPAPPLRPAELVQLELFTGDAAALARVCHALGMGLPSSVAAVAPGERPRFASFGKDLDGAVLARFDPDRRSYRLVERLAADELTDDALGALLLRSIRERHYGPARRD